MRVTAQQKCATRSKLAGQSASVTQGPRCVPDPRRGPSTAGRWGVLQARLFNSQPLPHFRVLLMGSYHGLVQLLLLTPKHSPWLPSAGEPSMRPTSEVQAPPCYLLPLFLLLLTTRDCHLVHWAASPATLWSGRTGAVAALFSFATRSTCQAHSRASVNSA